MGETNGTPRRPDLPRWMKRLAQKLRPYFDPKDWRTIESAKPPAPDPGDPKPPAGDPGST